MQKRHTRFFLLALGSWLVLTVPTVVPAGDYTGNVNFFLGGKQLDDHDWEPLDSHNEFGVLISWGHVDWPVQVAIDILGSADDETFLGHKIEATTTELDVGVRKVWEKGNARPFLGGGIAIINAEIEILSIDVDDQGFGAWIDGGVFWRLGQHFNVGLEVRISRAEVTFFDQDGEAGGEHLGLLLGWGW